jgi:hypothetical protein
MAATKNNNDAIAESLRQTLHSRNSSRSQRTLLGGTAMVLGEEDKGSCRCSTELTSVRDINELDVEAQNSLPNETASEKQDPNLV